MGCYLSSLGCCLQCRSDKKERVIEIFKECIDEIFEKKGTPFVFLHANLPKEKTEYKQIRNDEDDAVVTDCFFIRNDVHKCVNKLWIKSADHEIKKITLFQTITNPNHWHLNLSIEEVEDRGLN
jgi:hypothetical protein